MEVRPIDYVVPMVFHDDVEWQQDFLAVGRRYNENNLQDFVRWRSWGTEELLVRLVKKNMPWVRTIYILLAKESQVRDWMRPTPPVVATPSRWQRIWRWLLGKLRKAPVEEAVREPEVKVVFHREFMPAWALPTFNSCAIEMFLHRIPGISDRFIYGNDDMFPLSPMKEEDFFEGDLPCLHHAERAFPVEPNIFHMSCRNGLNFVAKEFNMRFTRTWLRGGHSLTPILKSTCEHLWERGRKEIEWSVSAFREPKNFNQWIYPWWHHLAGKYVDRAPNRAYVSVGKTVEEVAHAIDTFDGIVCVNDNECERDYEKYGAAVRKSLENRLNDGRKED